MHAINMITFGNFHLPFSQSILCQNWKSRTVLKSSWRADFKTILDFQFWQRIDWVNAGQRQIKISDSDHVYCTTVYIRRGKQVAQTMNKFYQWVWCLLLVHCALAKFPWYLWLNLEGKRLEKLLHKGATIDNLAKFLTDHPNLYNWYEATSFFICQVLALMSQQLNNFNTIKMTEKE